MAVEVSYVIITPYSLLKSRTGGIIARLMSRTDLEFIGAQMLPFSKQMAEEYAAELEKGSHAAVGKMLATYVRANFPPCELGWKMPCLRCMEHLGRSKAGYQGCKESRRRRANRRAAKSPENLRA